MILFGDNHHIRWVVNIHDSIPTVKKMDHSKVLLANREVVSISFDGLTGY